MLIRCALTWIYCGAVQYFYIVLSAMNTLAKGHGETRVEDGVLYSMKLIRNVRFCLRLHVPLCFFSLIDFHSHLLMVHLKNLDERFCNFVTCCRCQRVIGGWGESLFLTWTSPVCFSQDDPTLMSTLWYLSAEKRAPNRDEFDPQTWPDRLYLYRTCKGRMCPNRKLSERTVD